MKRIAISLLALSLCLSTVACTAKQPSQKDTPTNSASADAQTPANPTPSAPNSAEVASSLPTGGEPDAEQYYNTYVGADPNTLDISLRSDSYSFSTMNNTMEGLIRLEGVTGEYVTAPAEAESWDVNKDGTVWTFHLRDNIQWWDGVPVTADQYVYSLRRSAAPETGCPNSFFLEPIKNFDGVNNGTLPLEELGVKALDEKTLEITLSAPTPSFLAMISSTIYYPQREDKIKEWGEKFGSEAKYYIGNGPFKLVEWTHNNSLEFTKNDKYWDKDRVKLEKIHCAVMGEESTYLNAFQNGELDYTSTTSLEWMEKFKSEGAIHVPVMSQTLSVVSINTNDPLFKNLNVRKAFCLVIDREDMSDMCFNNLRLPCYGVIVPALTVGEKSFRDLAGNPIKEEQEALSAEGKTPKDLLIQGMEELGLGSDPSTLEVTLSLGGTSEFHKILGEYLQQVFTIEFGIQCNVEMMEYGIFSDKVHTGNYQLGFQTGSTYYSDPYDMLCLFKSSFDAFGSGWTSDEFDELLEKSSHEMDMDKRIEMYKQLENILLNENYVVIPLAYSLSQNFYQPYMRGCDVTAFGNSGYKYIYTTGRP